ncbi:hypothetical protein GA0070616_4398 [Micromonospora nigra]|uniref:Uncharacterized protein n=1 Tax=Micromonospora nigra TaxID=145857 RepID=A0A1C6SS41_9ACTN|nr:hypothetical protein [Micromonospora nigra]SCL32162.1 hypothetical protein GA0070616_4398 [Micromonospora nigra]
MTGPIPPHIAAATDQDRAELRQLVESARHHTDAMACEHAGTCAGGTVALALEDMPWQRVEVLLNLAIAELAVLGYGLPLHLTDAACAALEEPAPPAAPAPSRRWRR